MRYSIVAGPLLLLQLIAQGAASLVWAKYKKIVDNIPYSILLTDENNIIYNNKKSENIDFRSKEINNALFNSNKNGEFKQ